MKKIFWRVLVYFGLVLIVFTAVIGLMFTKFNRSNIVAVYRDELESLASTVAAKTSEAVRSNKQEDYLDFLDAMEGFCDMQNTDIWIVSNKSSPAAMDEDYTNVDILTVDLPLETQKILDAAYRGKRKAYSAYDDIYKKTMIHLAAPIRNKRGEVMGAVLVSGPMELQEKTIAQYQNYMFLCIIIGLFLAFVLALFFSRQIVRPIIKIKKSALILAAGQYEHKTGVRRNDELGALADSMDTLSERLVEGEKYREDMEQSRRDFFSNVSHELRTPITVVKGYADSLMDGVVSDEKKREEYIERIQKECSGMERLVTDLLTLSRMQNPDFTLDMEVLNIIAVVQDAMRGIRILMSEKKIKGNVEFADPCCFIEGDYDRIRQLFTILLQNAVKYCDEETDIDVFVKKENHKVIVTVRDFGSVIPQDEWENVFEKFYRASNHGGKDGSGLGLMVAGHIVERHSGKIYVTSSKEEGTSFFVEFPETSEPEE